MAERATHVSVAALNIAFVESDLHNDKGAYTRLLKAVFAMKEFVELRGEVVMTMDSLTTARDGRMTGYLVTMTRIDYLAWYNTTAHRPASESELGRIRVPSNMAANYREFEFAFFPEHHRFAFLTKASRSHLSPMRAWYFMQQLCRRSEIRQKFGDVSVSIEQEPEKLDAILNAENLRALEIVIHVPNAGFGGFDASIAESMAKMNAEKGKLSLTAAPGGGLKPDDDTRAAAKVALSNGEVTATVREEGVNKSVSTKDFPIVETVVRRPSKESRLAAVVRAARSLLNRILQT